MEKQIKSTAALNIRTTTGENYEITEEGSLGLLALGHVGLIAWRKKKQAIRKQQIANNQQQKVIKP